MLLVAACSVLFISAFTLVALRATQPEARYAWLVAVGGSMLAFVIVLSWGFQLPFELTLPAWQPRILFPTPIQFHADEIAWAFSLSVAGLLVAILLTAAVGSVVGTSLSWAGILLLGGLGVLAVTANNPLTLLMIWPLLDMTELAALLRSVNGERNNERVVVSFGTRSVGSALLLWAYIESYTANAPLHFQAMQSPASVYLLIAAGLRLGVLPLHLPYEPESSLRRGFGTAIRLIGAVSSLSVLGHVQIIATWVNPFLMILAMIAAVYGGWMWLRAPDELNGRPYWMIGIASLSILSALEGNPAGAAAWACALLLSGGAIFLSSVREVRISRALLFCAWCLSSLPFSLTAAAWTGTSWLIIPFAVAAQATILAGFIRHALRSSENKSLDGQPSWAKVAYPVGIILLIALQVFLGIFFQISLPQIGNWIPGLVASILTVGLFWATRRFRVFNPARAHWVGTASQGINNLYQGLWSVYRAFARIAQTANRALEGEGGIMWTLLFLALFISVIAGEIK